MCVRTCMRAYTRRVGNKPRARAGVVVGLRLIFQGCHYELPDIKFVSVDLPAVTVETPSHPRSVELFVALRSLLAQGASTMVVV